MEAMSYEFLLRRVYECGRNNSNGADADIYRRMSHAYADLSIKSMYRNDDDREYEFRMHFAGVRENVAKAIATGIKKMKYEANEEDIKQLEAMTDKLTLTFYDKQELDIIITKANDLFSKYGIVQ